MNFLSTIYRNVKIAVSGVGAILAIGTIIAGSVATHGGLAIFMIAGGSTWLASSGFTLYDSIVGHSFIKHDVDRLREGIKEFEKQNIELKENVNKLSGDIKDLEITKNDFINENKKLAHSVEESEIHVIKLFELKTKYEATIEKHSQVVEKEKITIEKLNNDIKQLEEIKRKFISENNKLQKLNNSNSLHITELETIKNKYINENNKLQKLNSENEMHVKRLEEQVFKLKELYNNAKELMKNLATAGDMFSEFSSTLDITANKFDNTHNEYDQTLNKMKNLLERLKSQTFDDLDQNDDGVVTESEFQTIIDRD